MASRAPFSIPGITRRRRKEKFKPVVFMPVQKVFKPQRMIKMLKDVSYWVNRDKASGAKVQFGYGKYYYIDDALADEFIIKGYAEGDTSRDYSDDEMAQIRSNIVNISAGG